MPQPPDHCCLIVFTRVPVPGRVKTRLAGAIGDDRALAVYRSLLAHTRSVIEPLEMDRCIYVDPPQEPGAAWPAWGFEEIASQSGSTLGERMLNAFTEQFERGYRRVIIIGSDNPELRTADILRASSALERVDVVLGPAGDGGYYLLGLNRLIPGLFQHMPWSSDRVLEETLRVLDDLAEPYRLLPVRRDIDTVADYEQLKHLLLPPVNG